MIFYEMIIISSYVRDNRIQWNNILHSYLHVLQG